MRLITPLTLMLLFHVGNATVNQTGSAKEQVIKGNSVMKEVFTRFHTNYEMRRLNKMGYYQESVSDSTSTYYLAESIVDIYIPCNLNQTDNAAIYPIKTRKKAYKEIEEDKLLFGNASDMARSSIWRPNSFLSEKNRDLYSFLYVGNTDLNSIPVSIVEFAPIDESHGNVKGRIYIDETYYGIVRIEYTPLTTNSKIWKEVSWSENFDFRNGAYELTKVKFEAICSKDGFQYEATLAMDHSETVSQIPEYMVYIGGETPLFDKAQENTPESFWEGFEFLKHLQPTQPQLIANR